MLYYCRRW